MRRRGVALIVVLWISAILTLLLYAFLMESEVEYALAEGYGRRRKAEQVALSGVDKAIAAHPTFLGTHVLLAAEWAVKTQNKAVFEEKLNWVLAQDPGAIPEVKPEAEAEQRKARALLAQKGDFFAD